MEMAQLTTLNLLLQQCTDTDLKGMNIFIKHLGILTRITVGKSMIMAYEPIYFHVVAGLVKNI